MSRRPYLDPTVPEAVAKLAREIPGTRGVFATAGDTVFAVVLADERSLYVDPTGHQLEYVGWRGAVPVIPESGWPLRRREHATNPQVDPQPDPASPGLALGVGLDGRG